MEKRKAHDDLSRVKSAVRSRGADALTAKALVGIHHIGLDVDEAIEVVCSISRADFYKSMTVHSSSRVWQDVYRPETPAGVAYVKLTLREDGAVVIQFKEK
jgi:motility quorum-sensing regulator / GCU-specific mRNA interferase toxin